MENNNLIENSGNTMTIDFKKFNKNNNFLAKAEEFEANAISFFIKNEEMMKITTEGFFWKKKLVKKDKEIYKKMIEFLNTWKNE